MADDSEVVLISCVSKWAATHTDQYQLRSEDISIEGFGPQS